ncbi:Sulfatase [Sulfitobacter guttiformis KCTC 32187]|nr:Sulfatase [Sulfitobacter guttiformis KCTC 32187]
MVLFLVMIQPNHPGAMTWDALRLFPLELPALIFTLIAVGDSKAGRILRATLVAGLTLIVILKTADLVSFNALSRGFNPVADMMLVDAFIRLLAGSMGVVMAVLAVLAAVTGMIIVTAVLWWAMGAWAQLSVPGARLFALPAVIAGTLMAAQVGKSMGGWPLPFDPPGAAFTARVGVERVSLIRRTIDETAAFRVQVREDTFRDARDLLDRIDRDVIVVFVESYGRTSHDTPLYAETHRATLARYESLLSAQGVAMKSGFVRAPTRGGQSWLSHATLANGMWIDNQVRYGAALASGRQTLFHHAANNGFRTAAVMPQITLEWPEATRMGFDDVLPAADLGYRGLPFNWVTMPDQFTLAAIDRLVRDPVQNRHSFVQTALATSHAPWVPIPEILDWDALGDGTVFNEIATSGDSPEVVWRDRDRVRAQYSLAIDYALSAVFEYALLHAADPPLMIVIGDHQAAEFVALDSRAHVPLHVIGPAHLVAALSVVAPDAGLLPAADSKVTPMDALRDAILTAYSSRLSGGATQ